MCTNFHSTTLQPGDDEFAAELLEGFGGEEGEEGEEEEEEEGFVGHLWRFQQGF